MLVISRREGELVRIGDAVVRITRVKGKTVYLAIDAPKEIEVRRISPGEERRNSFAEVKTVVEKLPVVGRATA